MSQTCVVSPPLYAFGLDPPVASWSNRHGAQTLLGRSPGDFDYDLTELVREPASAFMWCLAGFEWERWESSRMAYDAYDVARCGYTNWEMFVFSEHPEIWPRTSWWELGDDGSDVQVLNPLGGFDA